MWKSAALLIVFFSGLSYANKSNDLNILFIAVDDLKPALSNYGDNIAITPNIQNLANSSITFLNAYSQFPVCGPSRTSLLTGLRPDNTGVLNLKTRMRDVNKDTVTLPQHFKNNGYETAAVGKIFDPRNVDGRAKDDPESWSIPFKQVYGIVDKRREETTLAVKSIDAADDQFVDGVIARRGVTLINQMANEEKPFFIGVGFKKPHLPFVAPQKYFKLYKKSQFPLANNIGAPINSQAKFVLNDNKELFANYAPTPLLGKPKEVYGLEASLDQLQIRELLHGYYASVSFIDAQIGLLLNALKKNGEADNTIVVLWGDHGFHLGDHGLWGKHTTLEQANRVPLIISVPGYRPSSTSAIAELIDIFPTLTELAGLQTLPNLDGVSLVKSLKDSSHEARDFAISQYSRAGATGYSIRTRKYRYTEWTNKKNQTLVYRDLYDMENDPFETINIVDTPSLSKTVQTLSQKLNRVINAN